MSIKHIARIAGVSPATVSRVLNNPNYHCSSEEMRTAILQAARQLHYVPNEAARNLKKGTVTPSKLRCLGILVTQGQEGVEPFFQELVIFLEREIRHRGCVLSQIWYRPEFLAEIDRNQLDGLLVVGTCSRRRMNALREQYRNVVAVNRNSANDTVDEVLCDTEEGFAEAARYALLLLLDRIDGGHTSVTRMKVEPQLICREKDSAVEENVG